MFIVKAQCSSQTSIHAFLRLLTKFEHLPNSSTFDLLTVVDRLSSVEGL